MHRPVLVLFLLLAATSTLPAQRGDRPLVDGDRVLIKLWMDSIFADTARVQQGAIMLPRLGPMSVTGIPAELVADSVRRAYSSVFRPVTAEITALRRVTVLGEVRSPRVYYFEPGTRVREAIATAGGIPESGKSGYVTVLRDSTRTRLRDWQLRTDDESIVQSGDVLVVDRESWFKRNAFTVVSGTSVLLSIIITLTQR